MDAADGHMILKKEKQPTTTLPHMPFAKTNVCSSYY